MNAMKTTALMTVKDNAQAIKYQHPINTKYIFEISIIYIHIITSWRPSREYRWMSLKGQNELRKKSLIMAEGEDIPPPVKSFKVSRLERKKFQSSYRIYAYLKESLIFLQVMELINQLQFKCKVFRECNLNNKFIK